MLTLPNKVFYILRRLHHPLRGDAHRGGDAAAIAGAGPGSEAQSWSGRSLETGETLSYQPQLCLQLVSLRSFKNKKAEIISLAASQPGLAGPECPEIFLQNVWLKLARRERERKREMLIKTSCSRSTLASVGLAMAPPWWLPWSAATTTSSSPGASTTSARPSRYSRAGTYSTI